MKALVEHSAFRRCHDEFVAQAAEVWQLGPAQFFFETIVGGDYFGSEGDSSFG